MLKPNRETRTTKRVISYDVTNVKEH